MGINFFRIIFNGSFRVALKDKRSKYQLNFLLVDEYFNKYRNVKNLNILKGLYL